MPGGRSGLRVERRLQQPARDLPLPVCRRLRARRRRKDLRRCVGVCVFTAVCGWSVCVSWWLDRCCNIRLQTHEGSVRTSRSERTNTLTVCRPAEENRLLDHCRAGSHDCDVAERALCSYSGGSAYICSCLLGFVGDGRACRGEFRETTGEFYSPQTRPSA